MKKFLILAVLLVAGVGVAVYLNLGGAAKMLIERAGSDALGTKVSLGGLDISISERQAKLGSLTIDNPHGFAGGLLKAKTITVKLGEITDKVVTLNEVVVDGLSLNYAMGLAGTNFDALRSNMKSSPNRGGSSAEAPKVIIKRLKIDNAELIPVVEGIGNQPVTMPDIVLTDVGTKSKPATIAEASEQILNRVLNAGSNAVLKNKLTAPVKDAADKLKGLFK